MKVKLFLTVFILFMVSVTTGCNNINNSPVTNKQQPIINTNPSPIGQDIEKEKNKNNPPKPLENNLKNTSEKIVIKKDINKTPPEVPAKASVKTPIKSSTETSVVPTPKINFKISTTAFGNGQTIPSKYANTDVNGGQNTSIPLSWSGMPSGTKSFAILMYDLHPIADNFVHWAVINIPSDAASIPEGASDTSRMPLGSLELINNFGSKGYGGPQPPSGSGKHQYKTIIYALNTSNIDLSGEASLKSFLSAIEGKVIDKTEISGYFKR